MADHLDAHCIVRFEVECNTQWGDKVAVLGAGPLGGWDINQALHLHAVEFPVWVAETTLTGTAELEYKYVIVRELDDKRLSIVQWEHQDKNRLVKISGIQKLRIQEHFGEPDKSSIHTVLASNKSMT